MVITNDHISLPRCSTPSLQNTSNTPPLPRTVLRIIHPQSPWGGTLLNYFDLQKNNYLSTSTLMNCKICAECGPSWGWVTTWARPPPTSGRGRCRSVTRHSSPRTSGSRTSARPRRRRSVAWPPVTAVRSPMFSIRFSNDSQYEISFLHLNAISNWPYNANTANAFCCD